MVVTDHDCTNAQSRTRLRHATYLQDISSEHLRTILAESTGIPYRLDRTQKANSQTRAQPTHHCLRRTQRVTPGPWTVRSGSRALVHAGNNLPLMSHSYMRQAWPKPGIFNCSQRHICPESFPGRNKLSSCRTRDLPQPIHPGDIQKIIWQ